MTQKGLSRKALAACTAQLRIWKPFTMAAAASAMNPAAAGVTEKSQKSQKLRDLSALMESLEIQSVTGKKQCLRSKKGSSVCDIPDMKRLSLDEEKKEADHQEGSSRSRSRSFERRYDNGDGSKDNNHNSKSRKRRRCCRGGSCSGSGRSSDRCRNKICVSDPSASAAAAGLKGGAGVSVSANYATCSDFPIAGTDSSGELFNGDGNWSVADVSLNMSEVRNQLGKEKEEMLAASWQGFELQSNDSGGYGSEPGYRGDEEFGYDEDEDEFDDDLLPHTFWGPPAEAGQSQDDSVWRSSKCGISQNVQDYVQLSHKHILEQRSHHRFRRRRHDWREPEGSRHSLVCQNN